MRLIVLAIAAAVTLSACGGQLEQAQRDAPAIPRADNPVQLPIVPDPGYPSPAPVGPRDDELPGGYGWPTWGDCTDSLAC